MHTAYATLNFLIFASTLYAFPHEKRQLGLDQMPQPTAAAKLAERQQGGFLIPTSTVTSTMSNSASSPEGSDASYVQGAGGSEETYWRNNAELVHDDATRIHKRDNDDDDKNASNSTSSAVPNPTLANDELLEILAAQTEANKEILYKRDDNHNDKDKNASSTSSSAVPKPTFANDELLQILAARPELDREIIYRKRDDKDNIASNDELLKILSTEVNKESIYRK